jgi:hypothetical protein
LLTSGFYFNRVRKNRWGGLLEEFRTFEDLGYCRYKIIDQDLVEFQKCPNPAKEGRLCNYVFQRNVTGLFGDELPGSWLDAFEAIASYKQVFTAYALNGDYGFFSNLGSLAFLEKAHRRWLRLRGVPGVSEYPGPRNIAPPPGWHDTHAAR